MSKGVEINVEMGLCTKDMAKENPIKDFEILIEEYKDKWSTQMYDYFKECLNEITKKLKRLDELEKSYKQAIDMKCAMERIINRDSKKLKALDIIKTANLNVVYYGYIDDRDVYALRVGELEIKYNLTQEEYELLKEVGL